MSRRVIVPLLVLIISLFVGGNLLFALESTADGDIWETAFGQGDRTINATSGPISLTYRVTNTDGVAAAVFDEVRITNPFPSISSMTALLS